MAQYVTKVRTEKGDLLIDYNALANKPQSDTTLTKDGGFADAKAVGDKIDELSANITGLSSNIAEVSTRTTELSNSVDNITPQSIGAVATINGVSSGEAGNVQLTADNIGAAPSGYGLGKSQAITWDEIDTATAPGWYHIDGERAIDVYYSGLIEDSITADNWYMHVIAYNDGVDHCTQILYPVGITSRLHRIRTNGEFGEWQRAPELSDVSNVDAKFDNYLSLTGGTLTGNVKASSVGVDTSGIRNIMAGLDEYQSNETALETGAIYIQYE